MESRCLLPPPPTLDEAWRRGNGFIRQVDDIVFVIIVVLIVASTDIAHRLLWGKLCDARDLLSPIDMPQQSGMRRQCSSTGLCHRCHLCWCSCSQLYFLRWLLCCHCRTTAATTAIAQPPRDSPDVAAVPPLVQQFRRSSLIPRLSSTYLPEHTVSTIVLLILVPTYVKQTCQKPTKMTRHCQGPEWGNVAKCRADISRLVADMSPDTTYRPQNWWQRHPTCATKLTQRPDCFEWAIFYCSFILMWWDSHLFWLTPCCILNGWSPTTFVSNAYQNQIFD